MKHKNKRPKRTNANETVKNRLYRQAKELEKELIKERQKGKKDYDRKSAFL